MPRRFDANESSATPPISERRHFFLGRHSTIEELRRRATRLAEAPFPILILGESGVGKYELSNFIHSASSRRTEAFLDVHCANLQGALFDSELFGHERGSFTDARDRHIGHVERAGRGTILFDEIDCLNVELQSKLLRFVDMRTFERVGGRERLRSDAHLHFATNRDLPALVGEGGFRFDLLCRINWVTFRIPPLRDRPDDVVFLAGVFLEEARLSIARGPLRWGPKAIQSLRAYSWPGNVRELKTVATVAAYLHDGNGPIEAAEVAEILDARMQKPAAPPVSRLSDMRNDAERQIIEDALRKANGNRARAARLLQIGRRTLHEKLVRYRIS